MFRIVAADIGGTNSRFACFFADNNAKLSNEKSSWIETSSVDSFGELLSKFDAQDLPFTTAEADVVSIAAAGPVIDGVYCQPPYIDWEIDLSAASRDFGFKSFILMNDFVAQAFATQTELAKQSPVLLGPDDEEALEGTVGIIGAGTNLGKAMLLRLGSRSIALPSEGGHASFPAQTEEESKFLSFVRESLDVDYVTCENVVSGRGISLVHQFLTGEEATPAQVTGKFEPGSKTLEWCARFYARVCRNFALESLCLGGLFVAGGVAAKVPALIRHEAFSSEFRQSPKHQKLLKQIPVRLIKNEESGLWGAAFEGLQEMQGC